MTAQLRSELVKLTTTRTVPLMLAAAAGVTLLGTCIEGLSPSLAELAGSDEQRELLGAGSSAAILLGTYAGLIAVTAEFRYGTIRPTLMFEPRRRVVLTAKLAAAAATGAVFAAVCLAISFAGGLVILGLRDVDAVLTGADVRLLVLGTIAAAALIAAIGAAIGALIRNQAGAIVALVAYTLAVESVLFAALPAVGQYLPGKAGDALAGRPVEDLLAPGVGAAVLVVWTLALIAVASARNELSDV
jgi:ABC-type transport system involved in multi-copper enzyme maturation permease subunit